MFTVDPSRQEYREGVATTCKVASPTVPAPMSSIVMLSRWMRSPTSPAWSPATLDELIVAV